MRWFDSAAGQPLLSSALVLARGGTRGALYRLKMLMPKTTVLFARPLAAAVAVAALLASSACTTTQAPADSQLTGHWRLDPAASDNVSAKLADAISRAQARLRKRRSYLVGRGGTSGGGTGGNGGTGAGGNSDENLDLPGDFLGNGGRIAPDFRNLRQQLAQNLATPSGLVLDVQPDAVQVQRDALPAHDYASGETITRFDEYGTARLQSSWSGNAFVLRQRYTSGAQLIERYEVDPNGLLIYSRSLQDPTIGKLEVRSVYRRA